ncbi:hypothetical protein EWM58_04950 [Candidatus Erwinia dacicola]|nr:hypothetical protein [Candidatus Erwinia dacicola]
MGKRFSSHSHLVSIAHYISNKVSGLIRPSHSQKGSIFKAPRVRTHRGQRENLIRNCNELRS